MQIGAGSHDYVIDTIALHDELSELNGILSDPTILKVGLSSGHLKS